MTKLKYPVLEFKKSMTAFIEFAGMYNQNRPLRERLRPQHAKIFSRTLILASRQLYEQNKLFDDVPILRILESSNTFRVEANRESLSWVENTIKIDGNTVYRQLKRLINARIIVRKINHGSKKNFELFLNPVFLSFRDEAVKNSHNISKSISLKNQDVQTDVKTNCPPENSILKEPYNNLIIPVNILNRSGGDLNLDLKEKKNIRKSYRRLSNKKNVHLTENSLTTDQQATSSKTKEKKVAPAALSQSRLEQYQKEKGEDFFYHAIEQLFAGRANINDGNRDKARDYVTANYFSKCTSIKAVDKVYKAYKWRIQKAKRRIKRKNINMNFIFPYQYFDLDRTGTNPKTGVSYMTFANTASWPKKYLGFKEADKRKKQKAFEKELLKRAVQSMIDMPRVDHFVKCKGYLERQYPHLLEPFLLQVSELNGA